MNFLRRSPGVVHKQRRSLDTAGAVQYNSSQESLTSLAVGKDNGKDDSTDESKEDGQSRRSSFPVRVATIQEGDENKNGRRGSLGFEILENEQTDDDSVDAANQSIPLVNGLTGEDSSISSLVANNDNLSDSNTPTRRHQKHHHCNHSYHLHNRNSTDVESKNDGTDQLSSDYREDTTPDRLLSSPDTEAARFRPREMSFDKSFEHLVEKLSEKPADSISQDSGGRGETKSTASNGGSDRETATKISSDDIVVTVTKSSKHKKRSSALFTVLSPTYKSRSDDFKKFFKDVPTDERLIVDYSCAIQKDILVHGRLFITQNWVCFYANIFRWETVLTIPCKDITAITKEKTARVIPNAIQITTHKEKYFFTSFAARDKTFLMVFRIWQNALLDQPMTPKELWHWVHYCYGEELGLTSSDEDYVPLPIASNDLKEKMKGESSTSAVKDNDSTTEASVANGDFDQDSSAAAAMAPDSVFGQSEPLMISTPGVLAVGEDPTDFGDTTEDSEGIGEILCTGHEHFDKMYMNEIFNLSIDKVFDLLFSDHKFFRDFVGSNKTFDLDLPPWQDELDDDGNRFRHIKYTLTLGAAFGPKHSPTNEKQFCLKQSKPGVIYVVDCHIANGGIPYADSFYTINRYCITRVAQNRCRIKVTSEVKYRKSVWGLVKSLIEKNAHHGITTYYKNLSISLHKEASEQEHLMLGKVPSKKKRRRRRLLVSTADSHIPARQTEIISTPPSPIRSFSLREDPLLKLNADTLVRVIVFVLILLVMFNAVLFYKMWALEGFANGSHSPLQKFTTGKLQSYPESQDEWVKLLQQQQLLHHSEIDHWREILGTSVLLMDQMKATLLELKKSLDHHYEESGSGAHTDSRTESQTDIPVTSDKVVRS